MDEVRLTAELAQARLDAEEAAAAMKRARERHRAALLDLEALPDWVSVSPVAESQDASEASDTTATKSGNDETEFEIDGDPGAVPSAERDVALLATYHRRGLQQASLSFTMSLLFATIGFLIIATTIALTAIRNGGATDATLVALVGSTIIEAVAGLFFVQSNSARRMMEQSFDRLREDERKADAVRIAEEIDPGAVRDRLLACLALGFADRAGAADATLTSIVVDGQPVAVQEAP